RGACGAASHGQRPLAPLRLRSRRVAVRRGRARVRTVRARELRALRSELRARRAAAAPRRWNASPDDVQRSVVQLVLTLVDFLRHLLERQALRRVEEGTLSPAEIEAVGLALLRLEKTIRALARR